MTVAFKRAAPPCGRPRCSTGAAVLNCGPTTRREDRMAEARVRGVTINYEIVGQRGPFIALTPGSRRPYGELVALSKRIAEHGYRVLLHDRRNCGASEVAIEGT